MSKVYTASGIEKVSDFQVSGRDATGPGIWSAVLGMNNNAGTGTVVLITNRLYAVPFYAPRRSPDVSALIMQITAGVAGNVVCGIYDAVDSDRTLRPNNLVYNCAAQSTAAIATLTFPVSLSVIGGDLYFATFVGSGAATFVSLTLASQENTLGLTAATALTSQVSYVYRAFAYSATLPATFGAATLAGSITYPAIGITYGS